MGPNIKHAWRTIMDAVHTETVAELNSLLKHHGIDRVAEIPQNNYSFSEYEVKKDDKAPYLLLHTVVKKEVPHDRIKKIVILEHNKYSIDYIFYRLERKIFNTPENSWTSRKEISDYLKKQGYSLVEERTIIPFSPYFMLLLSLLTRNRTVEVYKKINQILKHTLLNKACRNKLYVGVKR